MRRSWAHLAALSLGLTLLVVATSCFGDAGDAGLADTMLVHSEPPPM
jgi:hypothetical protein